GVVPPQRELDANAVLLGAQHDGRLHQGHLGAVDEAHELADAAFVAHLLAFLVRMALIGEDHTHAGIEEGQLAQAMLQRRIVKFGDVVEGLARRPESHLGAALAGRISHDLEGRLRHSVAETDKMLLTVAPNLEFEDAGERVHHRYANAVKTTRY